MKKKRYKWNKYKFLNNLRVFKHNYSYELEMIGTFIGLISFIVFMYYFVWIMYFLGFR